MEFLGSIGSFIMTPLYYAISAILLGWHEVFSLFLAKDGGLSWALSIVGLTLVIRMMLIPLFVKQIKASRNMALIQPKVKELQKKYGHDRQRFAEESMKLYKDSGTNPFASCLPILLQMPIFFALFRLLNFASGRGGGFGSDGTPEGKGFLTDDRAADLGNADIFGFIPISDTFLVAAPWSPSPHFGVMLVALFLVLAMTATTFLTQHQLMRKNMPADALSGPYAQQQKMLLYILPLAFGFGGIFFPIGVLLYWTTSNLWTMGQQFYVIRNNPAPGTPAFKAKQERDRAKMAKHPEKYPEYQPPEEDAEVDEVSRRPAQRQQPKRQSRSQRRQSTGKQPTKQSTGKPATNKPATNKPATNKPATNKPATNKAKQKSSTKKQGGAK